MAVGIYSCKKDTIDLSAANEVDYYSLYTSSNDTLCQEGVFAPPYFTPNGDGINDNFFIYGNPDCINSFDLKIIKNRSKVIFESNDIQFGWDGSYKNDIAKEDSYKYEIKLVMSNGEAVVKEGTFNLVVF